MSRCANCPYKKRPIVEGFGPDKCDIVVVGESPGSEEHKVGRPFVGPSGQLLESVRESVGLPEMYLTNATLCTPPAKDKETEDGQPGPAVEACRAERIQEILAREPKVIVSMGGWAAECLIRDSKGITRRIGQVHYLRGIPVLLNVHPAYLLRGGFVDFTSFVDVYELAKKIVEGKAPHSMDVPYQVAESVEEGQAMIEELHSFASRGEPISLDLETAAFNPYAIEITGPHSYKRSRILLAIIGTREKSYLFPAKPIDMLNPLKQELKEFLERSDLELIMHVGVFDSAHLKNWGINVYPKYDTALIHYALDERTYVHGLKELSAIKLGVQDWEGDLAKYLPNRKKDSYEKIPPDVLNKYGSYDGVFTARLFEDIYPQLGAKEHQLLETLIMPAQKMFIDIRHRGMRIDTKRLIEVDEAISESVVDLTRIMQRESGRPLFNPGSPIQAAEVIYDQMKLVPIQAEGSSIRKMKTGASLQEGKNPERSTKDDSLDALPQVPFVKALRAHRGLAHDRSHYTLGIHRHLDDEDRIHPQVNLGGAVNGRLAYNDPSVMNIKRPPEPSKVESFDGTRYIMKDETQDVDIRSIFVADPGYVLWEADQSQFELRNYAAIAEIETMIGIFERGEDIHQFTDDLVNLQDRVMAKAVNFGLIYGLTLLSLAQRLGKDSQNPDDMREIRTIYDLLMTKMPGIKDFEVREMSSIEESGELVNPFGRSRRFPLITTNNKYKIKNEALNYRTSSTSSDLNLLSMTSLFQARRRLGLDLFWPIHDSVLGQVREDCLDSLLEVAETMACTAGTYLSGNFARVKYKVEMKVGENWGRMEKYLTVES